ncbi:uncharacterized protein MKZ38_004642 [Zalerion maritima]|uniref:Dihydrolipoamide acetyltransferase component of pyruvate dehydrogenase complex n=1 Tax=Zalerion maritima TaxID=339359 RepID=A0AAD5RLY2_9PEZI|nr:uncharacterized protein MKZ38_004642 [Zalerion maritima]
MFNKLQWGLRLTAGGNLGRILGTRCAAPPLPASFLRQRFFHGSRSLCAVKPYLLADIGEGITECQIISWSVKPGDRVQQFDAICEVQSDKASVEITSRYEGTVTKLHYEVDDMAAVGSPLLDIEVDNMDDGEDVSRDTARQQEDASSSAQRVTTTTPEASSQSSGGNDAPQHSEAEDKQSPESMSSDPLTGASGSGLVTPAVRRILKEHGLNPSDIRGSGKDGRILKEDVQKHVASVAPHSTSPSSSIPLEQEDGLEQDRPVPLSPIQAQMFQSMTRSLSIPHFLYTHTVDLTTLVGLLGRFKKDPSLSSNIRAGDSTVKLTVLPFVLKALSQAVMAFPGLNSVLDTDTDPGRPRLINKAAHNFGVAVDTSRGLLVPVVKNVQNHSIASLATEISRVSALAKEGKLNPNDMTGATLVVSNIGSIGGHTVAPVILAPMTAILAVGKIDQVPAFRTDASGHEEIVKKHQVVLSWSADHRVLDGATVARCAQRVGSWLEAIDSSGQVLK